MYKKYLENLKDTPIAKMYPHLFNTEENSKYKAVTFSLPQLKWESGLENHPNPHAKINTFTPEKDDLALVLNEEYIFTGEEWIKHVPEKEAKE